MSDPILLDTAIATLAARRDPTVLGRLAAARDVYVPEVVYGEMFWGAYRYARMHASTKFLDLAEEFVAYKEYQFLPADVETSRIYGAIRAELEAKGQIIQPNDMWIAALARQHGLILLTRDSDFARVTGLSFELL